MARPLDDAPDVLIDHARESLRHEQASQRHEEQGKRLARRLFIAFVIVMLLAFGFFVLLPQFGMEMPPIVPLMAFGVILAAALLNHDAEAPEEEAERRSRVASDDDARPIGCCSGPRPLRCFRDPKG